MEDIIAEVVQKFAGEMEDINALKAKKVAAEDVAVAGVKLSQKLVAEVNKLEADNLAQAARGAKNTRLWREKLERRDAEIRELKYALKAKRKELENFLAASGKPERVAENELLVVRQVSLQDELLTMNVSL